MQNKINIIFTTFKNEIVANKTINSILEKKLASCIKKINVESNYIWQNNIQKDFEIQLQIKTLPENITTLINFLKLHHEYQIPEILILDANTSSKYFTWMQENISIYKD